jgi:hypothetical protein
VAYDTALEARIDDAIAGWDQDVRKQKMFGGLGYLIEGRLCFAVRGRGGILLKVDGHEAERLCRTDGFERAVMGERVMKNWLHADGPAIATRAKLSAVLAVGRRAALGER